MRSSRTFLPQLVALAAMSISASPTFRDACEPVLTSTTLNGPEPKRKHKAQWKREATKGNRGRK